MQLTRNQKTRRGNIREYFGGSNPNLRAYYDLEAGRVIDTSGNNFHGTVVGTMNNQPHPPVPGFASSGVTFSGTDKMTLPNLGISGAMPRTIIAHITALSTATHPTVIYWGAEAQGQRCLLVVYEGTSVWLAFYNADMGTLANTILAGGNYIIAATYSGGTVLAGTAIYINGVQQALQSLGVPNLVTPNTPDGGYQIGNSSYGPGINPASRIAVFNRALSAKEIADYYAWATDRPTRRVWSVPIAIPGGYPVLHRNLRARRAA